jgi:hypothetical protein
VRFNRGQKWYQSIFLHLTWTADILLFKFKSNLLFKFQKLVSVAETKICTLSIYMGPRCKELTAESIFIFMADNFPAFPAENRF